MVLKISSSINFPAQVEAVSPIIITKTGGVYSFSFDNAAFLAQTRKEVSDADAIMAASQRWLAMKTLTATRTITLPAASAIAAGAALFVVDESGNCSPTIRIIAQVVGLDHINVGTSIAIESPYGIVVLYSNGVDRFFTFP
jgi:hypothetical protein